jgi:hypothetical protein
MNRLLTESRLPKLGMGMMVKCGVTVKGDGMMVDGVKEKATPQGCDLCGAGLPKSKEKEAVKTR